jgi:hypothetical protein
LRLNLLRQVLDTDTSRRNRYSPLPVMLLRQVALALWSLPLFFIEALADSACVPQTPPPNGIFSSEQMVAILKAHNDARNAVGASVMPILEWDERLAALAQDTAQSCIGLVHSSADNRTEQAAALGFQTLGENLGEGGAYSGLDINGGPKLVGLFVAERQYWLWVGGAPSP